MSLRTQVLSGLRWIAVAKFSTQLISWASTLVVMRLLSPDDYGLMAMAVIFVSFCQMINELGLGAAIIQKKELTEIQLKQVFGLVLLLNGFLFVLLLMGSPLIAEYFGEPKLTRVVSVLSLQFIFIAFSVIPGAILTRNMNFRSISIVGIISALSTCIVTFSLAWFGFSYWALVFGSLVGVIIRTIGLNIANPFIKWPSFNFSGFKDIAKFGAYVSLQRILWYVYSQADVFIVGKMLGKTLLGYYSVAMNLASLPMQKVGGTFQQVGLPAYSKLQDNRDLAAKYALKVTRVVAFIAFPVFFGISCVAPELVLLLIGEKWFLAILPLQLLSLVVPLRTLSVALGPSITGMGRPDINAINLAVACVIMPLAFVIGVRWGLKGVSIAWVISYSLWFVFMLSRSLPVIGLSMCRFFKALQGPAFVAAVMYFTVYMTRLGLNKLQMNDIFTFAVLIIVGVVVYSVGMLLFYREVCLELWDLRHS